MKLNVNPVRGTKDYLPTEMEVRQNIINIILNNYKQNGFQHIKTPILENIELLTGGDSGDNQKLMFKTIKRGEKLNLNDPDLTENSLCEEGLRYDLTVPLVRFYSKNRNNLSSPFKSIQIDESFRAERPQRGRNRQFTQCDIDILGDSTIVAEIEILMTALNTYKAIGFDNITLKINDRRILNSIILTSGFSENNITDICISLDKSDKIGLENVALELVDKNYEKANVDKLISIMQEIKENGISILDKYIQDVGIVENLKTVISILQNNCDKNHKIEFDISIIRGQGYYTAMVFETYTTDYNYTGALGGGGRYDNMVEKISGTPTPAVGYSIGLDPITMIMLESGKCFDNTKTIALIYNKEDNLEDVFDIKQKLVGKYNVSIFKYPKNMSAFLDKLVQNNFYGYTFTKDCLQTDSIENTPIKTFEK